MNKATNTLLAVAALTALTGTVSAQTESEPHQMLDPAWQQADELLDGSLNPQQHSLLNDIAFASAVDSLCEGFKLDRNKFSAEFAKLKHTRSDAMTTEQMDYFKQHLLFNYGLAVGLFMAEGALDQTGFCQQAAEQRDDPEASHLWQ